MPRRKKTATLRPPKLTNSEAINKLWVKTTVVLPSELWSHAKVQAILERTDFRSIVVKALKAYLANAKGGR